ncbi:DUF1150 family protein, partial [Vibrio parahaemolyticus]
MAHTSSRASKTKTVASMPIMTQAELANLGGGQVAYIKVLTSEQAQNMFPAVEGLPNGISLFSLHGADG